MLPLNYFSCHSCIHSCNYVLLSLVKIGETLLGIVVDWNDAEISGLGHAVGKDLATKLLRGCRVHWARSWQRVGDRIASSPDKSREKLVFTNIASKVTEIKGGESVLKPYVVKSKSHHC